MSFIRASSFFRHSSFDLRHFPLSFLRASSFLRHSTFVTRHFPHIGTCRKEARETKHFLRIVVRALPESKPEARKLWLEAKELHLIFSKIWRSG